MKTVSEPEEIALFSKKLRDHLQLFTDEHDLDTPSFMAIISDTFATCAGGALAQAKVSPAAAILGIQRTMAIVKELTLIAYIKHQETDFSDETPETKTEEEPHHHA